MGRAAAASSWPCRSETTKSSLEVLESWAWAVMNDKQRILVVDDEPQITRVLRRSLTSHGYDVRVAADGLAALQTFGDWPPDLVVTDLSMPDTDGLQLCRNLRAISQLPIIVLSVRGEESMKVQALDAGADD